MRQALLEKLPLGTAARGALLGLLLALPAAAEEGGSLAARIDAALLRLGPHASSAVRVVSLDRNQVLYERNADLSLNPASNQKLLTSAAALAKLGPEYRFRTRVLAGARRDDGRLRGPLYLQGGGDPALETAGLAALAEGVRAAGIRRIDGGVRVDDSRYDAARLGYGWNWDDEPYYYSAQISALSPNRNVVTVVITPAPEAEGALRVRVEPVEGYVRVTNRGRTGAAGSEPSLEVGRERGRNEVTVSGTLPAGAEPRRVRVTVEEPALYAGALFRRLLEERGIRVDGGVAAGAVPASAGEVAVHLSPPLAEIAALLNKPSDNLIAEMLLKELGRVHRGTGSASAGAAVVTEWLQENGIATGGLRISDGSGLSRVDLVTARAISDLLLRADRAPWREPFVASLPVAGVDGTLRSRMRETPAERNVRAKTGSLAHVTSLSGYVTTRGGERLAFSVLINHFPGPLSGPTGAKRVEDRIAVALAELPAPTGAALTAPPAGRYPLAGAVRPPDTPPAPTPRTATSTRFPLAF